MKHLSTYEIIVSINLLHRIYNNNNNNNINMVFVKLKKSNNIYEYV